MPIQNPRIEVLMRKELRDNISRVSASTTVHLHNHRYAGSQYTNARGIKRAKQARLFTTTDSRCDQILSRRLRNGRDVEIRNVRCDQTRCDY